MKGRKPRPRNMRIITGNAGKRPLPDKEPQPGVVKPEPPDFLDDVAKTHWQELVDVLTAARVMTELDVDALTLYCHAYSLWRHATEKVREEGMVVPTANGYPRQSPYVLIANRCYDQMFRLLAEFGMTPSSRTRVAVVDPGDGRWDL